MFIGSMNQEDTSFFLVECLNLPLASESQLINLITGDQTERTQKIFIRETRVSISHVKFREVELEIYAISKVNLHHCLNEDADTSTDSNG